MKVTARQGVVPLSARHGGKATNIEQAKASQANGKVGFKMGEKRILMATRSRVSGGAVVDGMKKSALKAARLAKEYRKEGMRPETAKRKAKETVAAEKAERGALNWKAVETGCNPLRKYGFDKPLFGTEKVCGGAKMRPIPCQKNYDRNAERLAIGRALRGGRKATAKKGAARK